MSLETLPWLSILAVTPLIGALVLWALPKTKAGAATKIALGFSLVTLVLFVGALLNFDRSASGTMQFTELHEWIPQMGTSYALGVNGVGLLLIGLSVLLVPLVIGAAWKEQGVGQATGPQELQDAQSKLRHYLALVLILEVFMVLIFAARDVFLFYVVFEAMLIPVYFMIGVFGKGARRRYAALKFLLFSLVGGLVMLVAVIGLYLKGPGGPQGFLIDNLVGVPLDTSLERWLFLGFFLAFAVKAPMFPVHTWLPDSTQHAPAGTSVLLVGVLDKVGTFGMLTLCLPLFPNAAQWAAPVIVVLAVISIIYGALLALGQRDLMRLIAYTSVSHFGVIVLGIFTFTELGTAGANFYMINHGLATGLLFLIAGFLFLRSRTGESQMIGEFGGMQKVTPVLAGVFLTVGLATLSMPGLSPFISEIMVLIAVFGVNNWAAIIAAIVVILAALYILLPYQKIFTGAIQEDLKDKPDLNVREKWVVGPLIALLLILGFVPGLALQFIEEPAQISVSTIEGNK
ncbi:NADH-quinone oxidoreductase subunit M [Jonesiaceae bacterium BS-20]|uniref:NADH-quinone oxidoreductase subunit M n=1 Tax=Jonesiaceae bacterium BS-20 TaxID=3120821 RepID=A0AAU7DVA2_9MICO